MVHDQIQSQHLPGRRLADWFPKAGSELFHRGRTVYQSCHRSKMVASRPSKTREMHPGCVDGKFDSFYLGATGTPKQVDKSLNCQPCRAQLLWLVRGEL